jgi:alanyl-tRNA synthetase
VATRLGAPLAEVEKKLEATLSHQKELEKELSSLRQKAAAGFAKELLAKACTGTIPSIVEEIPGADGNELQNIADALKGSFDGVILLAGVSGGAVSLVASVGKAHQGSLPAGKLISTVAPLVGGKGGGRPDSARGGGRDASALKNALEQAKDLIATGKI